MPKFHLLVCKHFKNQAKFISFLITHLKEIFDLVEFMLLIRELFNANAYSLHR